MSNLETSVLPAFLDALAAGRLEVIDLTTFLSSSTPALRLPEPFANLIDFSLEEVSAYNEPGPFRRHNNIHTGGPIGTHLDAPVHWTTTAGEGSARGRSVCPVFQERQPCRVSAQKPGGTGVRCRDDIRRARRDDATAVWTGARPQVDEPVRGRGYGDIVFGHDDGIARIEQRIECVHNTLDIGRVQARDGLIENDETGLTADGTALNGGCQLQSLSRTPGQLGGALAQP